MSKVVKDPGPTTLYGRPIVYDREICISICRKILLGEDLQTICAKPPMPIGPVFLGWVQDHTEARAIYRSVDNLRMDRGLASEVGVMRASIAKWEEQVRENCERGWPADWIERKYVPPDWNKVYPQLGGPPVWSTEDIEAYTELLNGFTEMLEPRDMMELILTKQAADATWEAGRMAREKNSLPERKYQQRLKVLAELQWRNRAAETTAAKPATALDHSLGLEAGFKSYQARDIAQSRAIKRRDNAPRQIARWRDGFGAKARRLSDKFIAEQALAESYGATQLLADTETEKELLMDIPTRISCGQPRGVEDEGAAGRARAASTDTRRPRQRSCFRARQSLPSSGLSSVDTDLGSTLPRPTFLGGNPPTNYCFSQQKPGVNRPIQDPPI
jgi:hypothetical protein